MLQLLGNIVEIETVLMLVALRLSRTHRRIFVTHKKRYCQTSKSVQVLRQTGHSFGSRFKISEGEAKEAFLDWATRHDALTFSVAVLFALTHFSATVFELSVRLVAGCYRDNTRKPEERQVAARKRVCGAPESRLLAILEL